MSARCYCSAEPSRLEPWQHSPECPFYDEPEPEPDDGGGQLGEEWPPPAPEPLTEPHWH